MKEFENEHIKIFDYSDEVLATLAKAKEPLLIALGQTAERYAKENEIRIDTGRLRNSITHVLQKDAGRTFSYTDDSGKKYSYQVRGGGDEDAVYIGTNVEYAPYIEFGTSKMGGIHFLANAIIEHKEEYASLIKKYLDQLSETG